MTKNQEKFIGVVGLGYWGKNIMRNFHELGVLHTACDSDAGTISARKESFPDIKFGRSFEEVLQTPSIKAIAIATPAATHYELVKRSLLEGKDVFVEKPLSLTVKEGEELVDIAFKEKRVLMVGHILQYHPAITRLQKMISSGELGKVQYIYSNRLNIGKLRTEENILWSFAPHDISVMLMLIGEELVKVTAFGEAYLNKGVYDTTMTNVEFKNGVKGHIFVSWLHPYKEQKLIVVGSEKMALFDDLSKEKLYFYPHKIEWMNGKIPVAHKADYEVVPVEWKEPLKEELNHFVECVLHRLTPKTDGVEGLQVLRVLSAAEVSLMNGASPGNCLRSGNKRADPYDYFVHESSFIQKGVEIGSGTKVWHFSNIMAGSRIGKRCIIGQNVFIGPDVSIGNGCKIQNNVSLYKGVVLQDNVFCGPSCVFTNVYNPRAFIERKTEFLPTLVKEGATIGANSTIVCGITIGRYALIGAGAVVKSDVADYAIVAGVPARPIGWACRCGVTLRFRGNHACCGYCGNEYELEGDLFTVIREGVNENTYA